MSRPSATDSPLILDHVVIIVDDLDEAITGFESLGFHVERGGRNGPVHNALIFFGDGTYIELTCPISKVTRRLFQLLYRLGLLRLLEVLRPGLMLRFYFWFGGPTGLRDWCVRSSAIDTDVREAEAAGIAMHGSRSFSRTRPDGQVAQWLLAGPVDRREPFLIEDCSPTVLRVPYQTASAHPNQVTGIRAVILAAPPPRMSLAGVPCRVVEAPDAPRLRLELTAAGSLKGVLPLDQTSGAWIEVV